VNAGGIFTAEGTIWKKERKLVGPALNRKNVREYVSIAKLIATRLVHKWESQILTVQQQQQIATTNQEEDEDETKAEIITNINDDLLAYSMDIISLVALAKDIDTLRNKKKKNKKPTPEPTGSPTFTPTGTFSPTSTATSLSTGTASSIGTVTTPPVPSPVQQPTDNDDFVELQIVLKTDYYPLDTSWQVNGPSGDLVMQGGKYEKRNKEYTFEKSVKRGCYTFIIFDVWGDGVCCAWGYGYYDIMYNGSVEVYDGGEFLGNEYTEVFGDC